MTIDAILERLRREDVLEVAGRRLSALARDRHGPRLRLQRPRRLRRQVLVDAGPVVVVVARDLFPRVRTPAAAAVAPVAAHMNAQRFRYSCLSLICSPSPGITP